MVGVLLILEGISICMIGSGCRGNVLVLCWCELVFLGRVIIVLCLVGG